MRCAIVKTAKIFKTSIFEADSIFALEETLIDNFNLLSIS